VQDLTLEVRHVNRVKIHQADLPNPRRREIPRDRAAQATGTDAKHRRVANLALPSHAHLRKDKVTGVATDFLVRKVDHTETPAP
jgi:hypothetical protein